MLASIAPVTAITLRVPVAIQQGWEWSWRIPTEALEEVWQKEFAPKEP